MKWIIRKFQKRASGDFELHETIEKHLRGELSPEEERVFRERIQNSVQIRKELQAWEEMHALLKDGRTAKRSEEYWEDYRKSLARKLDADPKPEAKAFSLPLWGLRPSYVAAVAMLVIAVLVAYRVWTPEKQANQLADAGEGNLFELCINEFDTVSQEEVIFEPPPQHPAVGK